MKNVIKIQLSESYYHIYARGNNKQPIFRDKNDFNYLLHLMDRYLSSKEVCDVNSRVYPNYNGKVTLLAFCLMPNHFHLLVYQDEAPYLEKFMQSLMTSYSRYLNLKYKQSGPVFESRYKAKMIDSEIHLMHISRYIHLNPKCWKKYPHSSLKYYSRKSNIPDWFNTLKILSLFSSSEEYNNFVSDYEEMHDSLKEIKHLILK